MASNFAGQIYLKMSVFSPVMEGCGTKKKKKTRHERQNWKTKSEFDSTKLLSTNPHTLCSPVDAQIFWSEKAEDNQTDTQFKPSTPFHFICFAAMFMPYFFFLVLCSPVNTPAELSAYLEVASWDLQCFPSKINRKSPPMAKRRLSLLWEAFSIIGTVDAWRLLHVKWSQLKKSLLLLCFQNQIF